MPGFGLCFGHQLLGQHLGATVETLSRFSEVGSVFCDLTEAGQADPVFTGLGGRFTAQTGHTDAVTTVPPGVTLLAKNDTLHTQAFRVDGTHFYSTQFHPDLTGAEAQNRYIAMQRALHESTSDATPEQVDRFVTDRDDTTGLLGRFITLVMSEGKAL
jgi:GMP synthase (glutamine-hydrolysing)